MLKKRTVVTSLSIAAIVLAGGAAVAANVGILSAADDTPMGTLSAEADLATVAPMSPSSTTAAGAPQRFVVENAGQVEVLRSGDTLALGEVLPSTGWEASPGAGTSDSAEVTFTSGTDRLIFTATLDADGTVTGAANRPGQSTELIPQATAASASTGTDDDDQADSDYDQADDDDDDHDKADHDNKKDDHDDSDHDDDGKDDDD